MQIVIEIPDEDVPNKQDIMEIDLHFIDGTVCECTYPFEIQEPCDDAISREAVLDLCDSKDEEYKVRHFREDVECLPSVHPECTEDYCPAAFKPVECEDCISRQAAIVALDNRMSSLEKVDMQIAMGFAKGIIHELPSGTPAEKVGHWINHKDEHQCSQCREIVIADKDIWEEYPYDYCPNCGAKMEVTP